MSKYQSLTGSSKGNSYYYLFTTHLHSYISPILQDFYQAPAKAGNRSRNAPQRQKSFCNYFSVLQKKNYSSELESDFLETTVCWHVEGTNPGHSTPCISHSTTTTTIAKKELITAEGCQDRSQKESQIYVSNPFPQIWFWRSTVAWNTIFSNTQPRHLLTHNPCNNHLRVCFMYAWLQRQQLD